MTDNEIIKTLECLCGGGDSCTECAYHKKYRFDECRKQVAKDTLGLVKRQQAEIERLKIENQSLRGAANSYKLHYNEARNEAVKEFVERLKKIIRLDDDCQYDCVNCYYECGDYVIDIDNLVKEMVGEENGKS